jgi:ABC-type multidrug transport system permease subunit
MSGSRTVRAVKGVLVAAVAAVVCRTGWEMLLARSDRFAAADPGVMGAGWIEAALAAVCGLLAMPVVLWAGMRLLGERGNHLLVVAGVTAWWLIGGHVVEDAGVGPAATALWLVLFALLCGVLSLVEMPSGRPASSADSG